MLLPFDPELREPEVEPGRLAALRNVCCPLVSLVDLHGRCDTIRGMDMVDHYCFLLSLGVAITLMALMAERSRPTRVEPPRPRSRENSAYAQIMKMAEQFAKKDPAEWWKRGESPPDCNLPDPNPFEPL